jgi:hypothetical protein
LSLQDNDATISLKEMKDSVGAIFKVNVPPTSLLSEGHGAIASLLTVP